MSRRPLRIETRQNAAVTFTREIIEHDGRLVRRFEPQKNLLLDSGLNILGAGTTQSWDSAFSQCVLGTGTTPTRRDSGVITFTRSATTVTASAGFFEAQDVGRLLKFDSGEEMYITAFTSGTQVTVSASGTLAAAEGTIYYVNVTGHGSESKRTGTTSSDSGANGYSWNGTTGVLSIWRTFLFTAETGPVTYREIGWSYTGTAGANLTGRALIAGGGDSLIAGQIYRVKVQFDISISPLGEVAFIVPTGIWAGATGKTRIEGVDLGAVTATSVGNLDPAHLGIVRLSSSAGALTAPIFGGAPLVAPVLGNANGYSLTADAYAPGSFTRTFRALVPANDANVANIRSVQFCRGNVANTGSLRLLLDANQTKTSNDTLLIVWRKSWGRVLVN